MRRRVRAGDANGNGAEERPVVFERFPVLFEAEEEVKLFKLNGLFADARAVASVGGCDVHS